MADVMERIQNDWPASRWDDLMPWNWSPPVDDDVATAPEAAAAVKTPSRTAYTPRQMEALIFVGRGKTDAAIGNILGVSKSTAHELVGICATSIWQYSTSFLIVRALFDGQITFADLLRR